MIELQELKKYLEDIKGYYLHTPPTNELEEEYQNGCTAVLLAVGGWVDKEIERKRGKY